MAVLPELLGPDHGAISPQVVALLRSPDPLALIFAACAFFLVLYFFFSGFVFLAAKLVDRPIDVRPARAGQMRSQIRREILVSARSAILFGIGMTIPWGLLKLGLTDVNDSAGPWTIAVEFVALVVWNDLHFYASHRLLHAGFGKLHAMHHRSVVATPFAAYCMSASEALLLGSVMPLAMLAHRFSIESLMLLPVWSIFINTLAHSNCDFLPATGGFRPLRFIRHHQDHHSHYHGNYGFFFCLLDEWFHTASGKRA